MTKQLSPLEALYDLFKNPFYIELGRVQGKTRFNNDIHIIETALKDYEKQKDYYAKLLESVLNDKEHKALEIIKETCEFDFIKEEVNDNPTRYEIHIRRKGKDNIYLPCLAIYPKSQEEFDLLKEELGK